MGGAASVHVKYEEPIVNGKWKRLLGYYIFLQTTFESSLSGFIKIMVFFFAPCLEKCSKIIKY